MALQTEALVVGGGATGVGVARDLALRGVGTVLVERGGLAAGTTGRSHGVLHSGARYAEADPESARDCRRENRTLRRIAGACVADTGGLFLALAADDPAYADRKRRGCEAAGIEIRELAPAGARERVPGLAPGVERVLRVPDAVVHPSRLVAATAAGAREAGADVRTHAPVTDLHVAGGAVRGAAVGGEVGGRVEAEVVVNATGPWAGECAALAGVDLPMAPTRGVMVGVDYPGLGPVLNRCRPPGDGDIAVPHPGEAVLGTTSVPVGDPDDYPREDWEVERTVAECAAMLPDLADAAVTRTYWGVRPLYDAAGAEMSPETGGGRDEPGRSASRDFAVLDHAADGAAGLLSVVGGKLTTHRLMAEAAADRVCERLGVDAGCRTAEEPLPGAGDPERLDALVEGFDAASPADRPVVDG